MHVTAVTTTTLLRTHRHDVFLQVLVEVKLAVLFDEVVLTYRCHKRET